MHPTQTQHLTSVPAPPINVFECPNALVQRPQRLKSSLDTCLLDAKGRATSNYGEAFMDTKLIAALACATALALGACSGNNASGTTGGGTGAGSGTDGGNGGADGGNGNGGTDGNGGGGGNPDGNGGADPTPLQTAERLLSAARMAATRAVETARMAAAAGGEEARDNAETLIGRASTALDDAVKAAEDAERAAAAAGSLAAVGLAARARIAADQLRTERARDLEAARQSLAWLGRALARYELATGEIVTPSEGTNKVTINRIPRTIPKQDNPNMEERNPKAFCQRSHEPATCTEDTFKTVMYEDGKKLFSDVDVEFKVDGYTRSTFSGRGTEDYVYTGVKLTRDGLVIRTGGGTPSPHNNLRADFTDTRRNIKYFTEATKPYNFDRARGNDPGPSGQNAWDLEITFINAPRTMPVPNAPDGRNWVASWQGNGDFYWKAIVPAAESQLDTDGEYYESDAFPQPDGYKDLGTYQVWLSNHIGVKRNLEPAAGREVACPDGSRGTSCPEDDEQLYLDYAAYGLFVYTANTKTFPGRVRRAGDHQIGRVNSLNFGYSAFADEENKRTTDIGKPITDGKFHGQALAYAYKGNNIAPPDPIQGPLTPFPQEFKLLRGDATLTVTIPKTGTGTITGTLNNFKEWTAAGWKVFGTDFKVDLTSDDPNGNIMTSGEFTGTATASSTDNVLGRAQQTILGDPYPTPTGSFKGAFYGPRDDSADLEVAGAWSTGQNNPNATNFDVVGSFGAKQRPAAAPDS